MDFDHWWRGSALETFDVIFHLAASLTKHSIDERHKMGMSAFSDTQLDYEVASWIERCRPRERVVWMSSSATDAKDTENYAFVKYVSERFGRHLGKHVPIALLKPYGGYGPRQSLNYPVPAIIDRALRHEDPLHVWGNKFTTRDWIFVDDLVEAMLMAADGGFPNAGAIPIGTGIPTTFAALASQIAHQVGYAPEIVADCSKPVGSGHRVAVTGIAEAYGFKAKVTLEEGIARCIAAARGKSVAV
jgi:nucleoside-diphosphate-sugar epimerase